MSRARQALLGFLALLGCVVGILAVLVTIVGFTNPELVTGLELGAGTLKAQVTETTGPIVSTVRLNPLLDLVLIVGSYVFVSLLGWGQDRLGSYVRERRHFE